LDSLHFNSNILEFIAFIVTARLTIKT
jgi:hypothetical protein